MNVFRALNIFIAVAVFAASALAARQYVVLRIMPRTGEARMELAHAAARTQGGPDISRYEGVFAGGVYGKGKFTLLGSTADRAPGAAAARADAALVGTAVGGMGYAIFQDMKSGRQALVEKGEEVFNIGVLTRIERDMAVVLSNGRELVFYMPAEEKPPAGAPPVAVPMGGGPNRGIVVPQGGATWIIDRRALDNVLANTDKLLTDARLLPYSVNGRTSGFTISEIKPGGLFSLMGFVNGDVILQVNNYAIDSPEKAAQILSGIKGESNVTLDILRGGQPKRLSYQIR